MSALLIALCGLPGAGKTAAQTMLADYGITPFDDKEILRNAMDSFFGWSARWLTEFEYKQTPAGLTQAHRTLATGDTRTRVTQGLLDIYMPGTDLGTYCGSLSQTVLRLPNEEGRMTDFTLEALLQEGVAAYMEAISGPGLPDAPTKRQIMGRFGDALERRHTTALFAHLAIDHANTQRAFVDPTGDFHRGFSFASVRLSQPQVYKDAGGIVLEVEREGCLAAGSYDLWDRDAVDATVRNDMTPAFFDRIRLTLDLILERRGEPPLSRQADAA